MRFADAGVVVAVGQFFFELGKAGAIGHGGGQGDHAAVAFRQRDHGVGEGVGPRLATALFDLDLTAVDRKAAGTMKLRRLARRDLVALAFDRLHVQQHRRLHVFQLREHVDHARQVMPVDRPHVLDAHGLEDLPGPKGVLHAVLKVPPQLFDSAADAARQLMDDSPADLLELLVSRADAHALEVLREGALRGADAHAVVVEDHEQLPAQRAGVVEAFQRDAVDDRRIADQGDDVVFLAQCLVSARHADGGGNGGSRVADGEKVVRRFFRAGEPAHRAFLAQSLKPARPPGQQLVGVGLMPHVKQQPVGAVGVGAEFEDVVQGDGQLDDAQVGGQVPAVATDRIDDAAAHLRRQGG